MAHGSTIDLHIPAVLLEPLLGEHHMGSILMEEDDNLKTNRGMGEQEGLNQQKIWDIFMLLFCNSTFKKTNKEDGFI